MHKLKILIGMLALAPLAAAPVSAGTQSSREIAADFTAIGIWMEQATAAMQLGAETFAAISPEFKAVIAQARDRKTIEAALPRLNALIARGRAGAAKWQAALAALPPAPGADLMRQAGVDPARIIADARAQNARMLVLIGDMEAMFAAIAAGELQRLPALVPKLLSGSVILIENRAAILRNRQVAIAPIRGWAGAQEGRGQGSVARMRSDLASFSRELQVLTETGRINLAREQRELETALGQMRGDDSARSVIERSLRMFTEEERLFAVGDELAASMEHGASPRRQPS